MSLSPLVEIPSLSDYVKALLKLLDEYESFVEGKGGAGAAAAEAAGVGSISAGSAVKMRSMFKSGSKIGKRPSAGSATGAAGTGDIGGPGTGTGVDTTGESFLITSSCVSAVLLCLSITETLG